MWESSSKVQKIEDSHPPPPRSTEYKDLGTSMKPRKENCVEKHMVRLRKTDLSPSNCVHIRTVLQIFKEKELIGSVLGHCQERIK